ncbi:MAG: PhoH family protein, partial [Mycobacteriales bacterium]
METFVVPPAIDMVRLLGHRDVTLRAVEQALPGTDVHVRGNEVTLTGPDATLARRLVVELVAMVGRGQVIGPDQVRNTLSLLRSAESAERPADVLSMGIVSSRGRTVRPKSLNQKRYVDAIDSHTIVF